MNSGARGLVAVAVVVLGVTAASASTSASASPALACVCGQACASANGVVGTCGVNGDCGQWLVPPQCPAVGEQTTAGVATCCPLPAPMAPNVQCADGTVGGPYCTKGCTWAKRQCPSTTTVGPDAATIAVDATTSDAGAAAWANCAVMADSLMGQGSSTLDEDNPICDTGINDDGTDYCKLQIALGYYTTCKATCGRVGAVCNGGWRELNNIWCQVGPEAGCNESLWSMVCSCSPAPTNPDATTPTPLRCDEAPCHGKSCAQWADNGVDAAGVYPDCDDCRSCQNSCSWWTCAD